MEHDELMADKNMNMENIKSSKKQNKNIQKLKSAYLLQWFVLLDILSFS